LGYHLILDTSYTGALVCYDLEGPIWVGNHVSSLKTIVSLLRREIEYLASRIAQEIVAQEYSLGYKSIDEIIENMLIRFDSCKVYIGIFPYGLAIGYCLL
jgi:hypothetical protein